MYQTDRDYQNKRKFGVHKNFKTFTVAVRMVLVKVQVYGTVLKNILLSNHTGMLFAKSNYSTYCIIYLFRYLYKIIIILKSINILLDAQNQ